MEEYLEQVKTYGEKSNFDYQEEIKSRLVREGVRETSAIVMADQYYGFPAGGVLAS